MKLERAFGLSSVLWLSVMPLAAQETNNVERLKKQLQELKENFQKVQQQQHEQIEALQKQIEALQKAAATNPPSSTTAPPVTAAQMSQPWSPTQPMRIGGGQNYINLSFDALVAAGWSTAKDIESLQRGGHDPKQRGFTVQNLETVFDGRIDPYFRGQANVVLQIDPQGETTIEAEEAYLETMALPWNFQVKAGQFFSEFGRLNPTHPHTWDFVDQPLVNGRLFGDDGLRNPGARVSWLMPTPFYSELFFTVQDSQGETAQSFRNSHGGDLFLGRLHDTGHVKSAGDMLFVPRYAASIDLTDAQTLVAGVSAAFGPNGSAEDADTQIYGVDLFWKWKSPQQHAGFPFVTWQTEALLRRFGAAAFSNTGDDLNGSGSIDNGEFDLYGDGSVRALPRETLTDYGAYSQVAYGFRKGWVAAMRGDWVSSEVAQYERLYGRDADRATRWRLSPNLTYYPSEFSKIRLQYNYDWRDLIGPDHSVWVQFEFLLGAHAAHKL